MYDNFLDSLEPSDRVLSLSDLPSQESVDWDMKSLVRAVSISDVEDSSYLPFNIKLAYELSSLSAHEMSDRRQFSFC